MNNSYCGWKITCDLPKKGSFGNGRTKGLDLVQIHYDPVKQVCTALLTDYGKYMYRKQKMREKKKTQKQKVLKELKINYSIWNNDLELK